MKSLPVWMLSFVVCCLVLVVMTTGCAPQIQVNYQLRNILQGRRIAVCSYAQSDVVSAVEYAMRQLYGVNVMSSRQCNAGATIADTEFLLKIEASNSGGSLGYMLANQQGHQQAWVKILDSQGVIVAMGYAESSNVRMAGAVGNSRNFGGARYRSNESLADLAQAATFNLR